MKNKIVITLLSFVCAICFALGFTACDNFQSGINSGDLNSEQTVGDSTHAHTMTYYAAVTVTCTTDGNIAYWYCSGCNKYFSDENGVTEIKLTDTIIDAIGHSYDSDYICTSCGAYDKDSLIEIENERHETALTELYNDYIEQYDKVQDKIDSYNSKITTTAATCSSKLSSLSSTISSLQTQIAIAKLDTSTSGQAKLKKLQSQLEEYQEEYDYYSKQSSYIDLRDQYQSQLTSLTKSYDNSVESENELHESNLAEINNLDYSNSYDLDIEEETSSSIEQNENYSTNLEYTLNSDGESYSVSGIGNSKDTELVIPSTYNDKPVTAIADKAFYQDMTITSVTIGNNVTSIGVSSFYNCLYLTDITISNSVASIGEYAFADCFYISTITIPASVTYIGDYAFNGCTSLTNIEVSSKSTSFKSINNVLYNYDGTKLIQYAAGKTNTSYPIPSTVTTICAGAFDECISLISITIPNSVISIEDNAFNYCTALTSISIPNSVVSIGNYAFCGCYSLESIIVESNNANYKSVDGNLYSYDGTRLIQYAIGNTHTSFTIPSSVIYISDGAFCGCTSLISITIGDNVVSIGDLAFYYCSALTSISIPDSVISIGNYAFCCCYSLESITVESNNTKYKSVDGNLYSYDGTTLIQYAIGNTRTSFNIPESVSYISEYSFYGCTSLISITIGNNVTSIGECAFCWCSQLISIIIPANVNYIGNYAFSLCYSLTSVCFENTNGWYITTIKDSTSGIIMSNSELINTSTAATYLTSSYNDFYWYRGE